MVSKFVIGFIGAACFLALAQAYSGGAPVDVCEDMTPKHPASPQKSKIPYDVKVNSDAVAAGGVVKITVGGNNGYKGLLVQVRNGNDVVGKFLVADDDKYVKTIDCGNRIQNTITHKNSEVKNNLTFNWQAPAGLNKKVQVYVTVAEDGGTYWVRQPTASITVN